MDVDVATLITRQRIAAVEADTREVSGPAQAHEKIDLLTLTLRDLKLLLDYEHHIDTELSDRAISLGVKTPLHGQVDRLRAAQALLHSGDPHTAGVPMDEVQFLVGRTGIEETEHLIRMIKERRRMMRKFVKDFPTANATKKYRFVGREGQHRYADGTFAKKGDVVELSATAADALVTKLKRFVPVESDEEEVTATA